MRIGVGIRVEYLSSAWMAIEALGSVGFGLIAGSFACRPRVGVAEGFWENGAL